MVPLGDDDYENFVDQSFKLGARVSFFGAPASRDKMNLGLELDFDWTPTANDLDDSNTLDASFTRLRALVAVRARKRLGANTMVFLRAGGGLDYVIGSIKGTIIIPVDAEDNDLGVALELGGGVLTRIGGGFVGMQVALPIALHFGDQEPFDYDYTGVDFDLLFTAGTEF